MARAISAGERKAPVGTFPGGDAETTRAVSGGGIDDAGQLSSAWWSCRPRWGRGGDHIARSMENAPPSTARTSLYCRRTTAPAPTEEALFLLGDARLKNCQAGGLDDWHQSQTRFASMLFPSSL